uniref:Helix-turn-helix domain-containing protein n=1 Tax=Caldilinea aerophila TaxID=133453 RepID=A0A7C1FU23_9CHLR
MGKNIATPISYGLRSWRCHPDLMTLAHRHNDIELNFLLAGEVVYIYRDQKVRLSPGRLAIFWAAIPHQLIERPPLCDFCIFTLPLELFLSWKLPPRFVHTVLNGDVIVDCDPTSASIDSLMFSRWHIDLSANPDSIVVLKELEARLWRLAWQHSVSPDGQHQEPSTVAERMAQYIISNYQTLLSVKEVADAVGLHPNYAMNCFKRTFNMTIWEYTLQYRVAQAQRLLATSDTSVLDVALQSGFRSLSSFYAAFQRFTGKTPTDVRRVEKKSLKVT